MELWTPEHTRTLLPALLLMILAAVVLRLTIGKKSLAVRMIPIQIIAVLLLVLEIGKQAYSLSKGYDLYHLPFHFCSLFLSSLPIMAFYRGKHQNVVFGVVSALCSAMFILMIAYPNLIYSAGNILAYQVDFLSFHTVTFHNAVMFAFVLIVALGVHTPQKKGEVKAVVLVTIGFCVVAATMAQLLKTNYGNFYSCNIAPLEAIRVSVQQALGAGVAQLLYVSILTGLHLLFVPGAYWFYRLLRWLTASRKTAEIPA